MKEFFEINEKKIKFLIYEPNIFKRFRRIVEKINPELSKNISPKILDFEKVILLSDKTLEKIFNIPDTKQVAIACKGIKKRKINKILNNLSKKNKSEVNNFIKDKEKYSDVEVIKAREKILQPLVNFFNYYKYW